MLLLVDDSEEFRIVTKWFLESVGYTVELAQNPAEALALFDPKVHRAVITDNSMPGMSGAEMARILKLRSPSTPIIMFTGQAPADLVCIDKVIERPSHVSVLKEAIDTLLAGSRPAGGLTPASGPAEVSSQVNGSRTDQAAEAVEPPPPGDGSLPGRRTKRAKR
jgi:CheY-like chemotaxis protein